MNTSESSGTLIQRSQNHSCSMGVNAFLAEVFLSVIIAQWDCPYETDSPIVLFIPP